MNVEIFNPTYSKYYSHVMDIKKMIEACVERLASLKHAARNRDPQGSSEHTLRSMVD